MTDPNFEPLIAAHDFASSRLIYFFNNDEFSDASFVLNEFEVFAIFLVTISFIQDNEDVELSAKLLEQFHQTIVERIVGRIVENQPSEVSEEQEEVLEAKILAIFQERLRLYFNVFKKQDDQGERVFVSLADTFMEHALQSQTDGQMVERFSSFSYELFLELVTLLKKGFEIKDTISPKAG